jgi:hypothetical protein
MVSGRISDCSGVGRFAWYTLADYRWYTLTGDPWYTLADYWWYIIARLLTWSSRWM